VAELVDARPSGADNREVVLQFVQPALAGMMDGSVSTLAPLLPRRWPRATLTHVSRRPGRGGGAGISMAFAEALSDDGSLTGRGNPWFPR